MNDVLCLAVGKTYEMVINTNITAHPDIAPYPRTIFNYLIPIKKGGDLEFLYEIKKRIVCLPNDVYNYKNSLSDEEFTSLTKYHELRKNSFGYSKTNTNYTFYILGKSYPITQPFQKKGIQIDVKLDLNEIPINEKKQENYIKSRYLYVGITDTKWINFIKEHNDNIGDYINFWTPGTKVFKAIEAGELFLFKLHSKKSKGENGEIVGGAYFDRFEQMSISKAWEHFGYGNGTTSYLELQSSISQYRIRNNMDIQSDIGCIILKNPFFFEKDKWIESPTDWKKSIVSGKKYDMTTKIGYDLYQRVTNEINTNTDNKLISIIESELEKLPINGKERETYIKVRVNQGIFRNQLLKKYNKCCLCNVCNSNFLIASHIKPWSVSKQIEKLDADNGLLLCPNHDALFDTGYISFSDDGYILVSEHLEQVDAMFMNVNKNAKIKLTNGNKKYLFYHREHIFKK